MQKAEGLAQSILVSYVRYGVSTNVYIYTYLDISIHKDLLVVQRIGSEHGSAELNQSSLLSPLLNRHAA